MNTRFETHRDLARLPYFQVVEGELRLADPSLGPAIDMHTHLALSYLTPSTVDLERETARTMHYLDVDDPVELDVYANKNFSPDALKRLTHDLTWAALGASGMRSTHTFPNLSREMRGLGIRQSVLLPIDAPVLSNNAERWLEGARRRTEFIGFGSVHPLRPDAGRILDAQKRLGARGIKLHPAVQMVGPDHRLCLRVCRMCGERDLPVLFHCGPVDIETRLGRRLSQVYRYEKAIAECPGTRFVLGHSGALQYPEGIALAGRYPNVWLELASQSLTGVQRILAEAPQDRIVFGSDWPFYHQGPPLAKVFLATEGNDKLRRDVLHDNAARLLGVPPVPAPTARERGLID